MTTCINKVHIVHNKNLRCDCGEVEAIYEVTYTCDLCGESTLHSAHIYPWGELCDVCNTHHINQVADEQFGNDKKVLG